MKASKYQDAIYSWVKDGSGNAVVEAVAGSGKTTTLLEALGLMKGRVLFTAFNKHIAEALSLRAPVSATVSTIHALGFAAIKKFSRNVKVEGNKMRWIVQDYFGDEFESRTMRMAAERLASLARLTLTDENDEEAVRALIDHYDIDANGSTDAIVEALPLLLKRDRDEAVSRVDFDDMVYLPNALGLKPDKFDWVCVDEAQDLNAAQRTLVLKAVTDGGRVLAVGDRRQAIYGFAGADTSSIPTITEKLNAKVLPLSICYRCPVSHVKLAKEIVPQIEAREGAPEGVIDHPTLSDAIRKLVDGDLVVCRANAPLVEVALSLIRAGKKATLRGRDISSGLLALVRKQKGCGEDLKKMIEKLSEYRDREADKLEKAKKNGQADSLRDRVETVIALSDGITSVRGLENRIESIFSDEKTGIVCSSVHRAKGLEANRVMVFKPSLMPHRRAVTEADMDQEKNLIYVSRTRAKMELWFVE